MSTNLSVTTDTGLAVCDLCTTLIHNTTVISTSPGDGLSSDTGSQTVSSSTEVNMRFTPTMSNNQPQRITLDDILSEYWEYTGARDLCLYGYPVILILGTLGNFLTLVVMLKSEMRKRSTGFYMCALSVFDTLVLYFSCFRQWFSMVRDSEVLATSDAACKTMNFLSYTLFDVAVWLLIVMTLERFLVVRFPLLAPKVASVTIARNCLAVLVMAMCTFNVHFFWTVSLDERGHCRYTDEYRHFHDSVWPWMDATVYSFLPFLLLLILNILIIHIHRRATVIRKTRIRLHSGEMSTPRIVGVQLRLTTMLIAVTMTFLLLSAPNVILICIRHKYFDFSEKINDFRDIAVYRFVAMVTNFCLYLNHAINFFLYCISGERFRRDLLSMLRCTRRRKRTWSAGYSDASGRSVKLVELSVINQVHMRYRMSTDERV